MIPILYQDRQVVVCLKPAGVSSEADGLAAILKKELNKETVYCVHRLDRDVGGVMVYALTKPAAASLSAAVAERRVEKEYLAVVPGVPEPPSGTLRDLLFHDKVRNKTYVVDRMRRGVKEAVLSYDMLARGYQSSLLRIRLHTGRSHQIRVQFASRRLPLLGDLKYGSTYSCPIALWAESLRFPHPVTGELISFSVLPARVFPWDSFTTLFQEDEHEIH